jgi:hypothetical protein
VDEFTDLDAGNIVPALVATGVWLAVGAALDIYLLRSNKSHLITDVLRTPPGKIFLTVLGLHVVDVLGKADPFSGAGRFIKTRRGVVMLVPVPSLSDADTGN